jgi:2-polyprenyl-3-methyl-5-hydroxy-6-metoxy-1,4-benzoquinol methylase
MPSPPNEPSISSQRKFWDDWNAAAREHHITDVSRRQGELACREIAGLGRKDLALIDVGCGTGWLCDSLQLFGRTFATDFSDSVVARAAARLPSVTFVAGDFFAVDLPKAYFDVAVSLEMLSHVADQKSFLDRLADLLKPGGLLVLATQNRPVFERWSVVEAPNSGRLRHWVDRHELRTLLQDRFDVRKIGSICPVGDRGVLRIVNSPKLNRLLSILFSQGRLDRLKESLMLGHTLMAYATRR